MNEWTLVFILTANTPSHRPGSSDYPFGYYSFSGPIRSSLPFTSQPSARPGTRIIIIIIIYLFISFILNSVISSAFRYIPILHELLGHSRTTTLLFPVILASHSPERLSPPVPIPLRPLPPCYHPSMPCLFHPRRFSYHDFLIRPCTRSSPPTSPLVIERANDLVPFLLPSVILCLIVDFDRRSPPQRMPQRLLPSRPLSRRGYLIKSVCVSSR